MTEGLTGQGQIVGSLHYMSPEQLQGTVADSRSDLFSFGLILYEMLVGKRAYEGTSISLIADIIHKDPPGLVALHNIAPPFESIVKTCLAKDPERRWQSAHELKQVLESATSATFVPQLPAQKPRRWVALAVAVVVAGGLGFWLGRPVQTPTPEVRSLHLLGPRLFSTASPDGRSIAFASKRDGVSRIWLKELSRGSEVPLTAGPDNLPRYSPDGSMILFTRFEDMRASLYRVPVVGGEPRKVMDNALFGDWSPDGRQIVFVRQRYQPGGTTTILAKADTDGGTERVIFESKSDGPIHANPTWSSEVHEHIRWSPDGKTIAVTQGGLASVTPSSIFLVGADGTNPHTVAPEAGGFSISSLAWLGTPDEVIYTQTQTVGSAAGGTRGIRHNLRTGKFQRVFSSTDITSVADVLGSGRVIFDSARPSQSLREIDLRGKPGSIVERLLTRGNSHDRQPTYSPNGEAMLFSSNRSGNLDLWEVSTRTGALRRITDDPANDWDPAYSPDGKNIVWSSNRSGHQEIWIARADGGSPRQVSSDGQDAENPVFLHDGQSILYVSWNPAKLGVWKVSTDGSMARLFLPGYSYAEVSPDGQYVASLSATEAIRAFRTNDASTVGFEIKHGGRLRWMPDGRAVAFVDLNDNGIPGIFVQDFVPGRDTGKTRRPLGGFDSDRQAETFGISPTGGRLAISSTENLTNIVVATDVAGITVPRRSR